VSDLSAVVLRRVTYLVLAATLVPAIMLVVTSVSLNRHAGEVMEQRVQETLGLAINLEHSLIDGQLARMKDLAVLLATSPAVVGAFTTGELPPGLLTTYAEALPGTDLMVLADRTGKVVGRAESDNLGDVVLYNGLLPQVVETDEAHASVVRIPREELAFERGAVQAQVRIPIQPTEASTDARAGTTLADGLALVGAAPVRDSRGRVLGAVLVSDLLNNDYKIVDDVTSRSPVGLPVHATIALDGVRVTTNVPAPGGGRRAVGWLYSDVVMQQLRAGQEYRGRALVGGHVWERTIYVPLLDHAGRVVAGSFVGVPEESFTVLVHRTATTTWISVLVALVSLAGAGIISHRLAMRGLAGIRHTTQQMARISHGVKEASSRLATEARQTAAHADGVLAVAAGALEAAEQVGVGAQRVIAQVGELELALARIGSTAQEQARAIRHANLAIGQVNEAALGSRRALAGLLELTQEAAAAAQQGRRSALRTMAALELVRLTVPPATGDARFEGDLERTHQTAAELSETIKAISQATEGARTQLWELAAVLSENGARVGAVTQQVSDLAAVADETAVRISTTGSASRAMLAGVEAMAGGAGEAVTAVKEARGHVTAIAESGRALSELSDRIRTLADELDTVAGAFAKE
jgi:methyl-accepting chemotaxis protein